MRSPTSPPPRDTQHAGSICTSYDCPPGFLAMAVEGQPGRLLRERNGVVDVEVVVDARSPAIGGPGRRVDTPGDHRAMSRDQPPAGPSTDRVSATGRVALSAHEVFLILCDPARHVEIDDSAMVRAAPDATRLTEVGQTFDVEMD